MSNCSNFKFKLMEKTLLVIKPDGVKRGLVGEITGRFECLGLKIAGVKMVRIDNEFASKHYNKDEEWLRKVGRNMLKFYEENGKDSREDLGTKDELELGRKVQGWLFDYVTEGPVVAVVFEGPHAAEIVRKHMGSMNPADSLPGTIRGDLGHDSSDIANFGGRSVRNLAHCSGNKEEAEFEIKLWFKESELHEYSRE